MPSEDTAPPVLQQHVQNQNVGMVKKQVGVAFTYPNIHLSAWFLDSTAVRISEGLLNVCLVISCVELYVYKSQCCLLDYVI